MNASHPLSLDELQTLIRQGIDKAHPLPYWVTAEISEKKVNVSGHCYLELVEKGGANHVPKAKALAVIWRSQYAMIASYFRSATGQELQAGMKVLVKVVVSYHALYGLSLQITDIDPAYTLGDMERQRLETIQKLQEDGVYDMNRELPLPCVMQRIAVVSSPRAAGYQDFMRELSVGPYRFEVTLFEAFMQGNGAEDSIVEALSRAAERYEEFDVLVVIRGGGSQSDIICQITADIMGREVYRVQTYETSGLGCSIVAFNTLNYYKSIEEAVSKMVRVKDTFKPIEENHAKYMQFYNRVYKKIYERNLPIYNELYKMMEKDRL